MTFGINVCHTIERISLSLFFARTCFVVCKSHNLWNDNSWRASHTICEWQQLTRAECCVQLMASDMLFCVQVTQFVLWDDNSWPWKWHYLKDNLALLCEKTGKWHFPRYEIALKLLMVQRMRLHCSEKECARASLFTSVVVCCCLHDGLTVTSWNPDELRNEINRILQHNFLWGIILFTVRLDKIRVPKQGSLFWWPAVSRQESFFAAECGVCMARLVALYRRIVRTRSQGSQKCDTKPSREWPHRRRRTNGHFHDARSQGDTAKYARWRDRRRRRRRRRRCPNHHSRRPHPSYWRGVPRKNQDEKC